MIGRFKRVKEFGAAFQQRVRAIAGGRLRVPGQLGDRGLVVGHSHLISFGVPLRTEDGTFTVTPLDHSSGAFLCLNGPFPREESYWIEAERLAPNYKLFIYWGGHQHVALYLFASEPRFDFVFSEEPGLPVLEEAVLVPEQMLREDFMPSFKDLEQFLSRVIPRTGRVFICGTPPPKDDLAVVRAGLANEVFFVDRLAALGATPETVPLTSPYVLYKMWRLHQAMLREVADSWGVPFLEFPREAQTSRGFLRREYWAADVTHANRELGRLLLPRLREYL